MGSVTNLNRIDYTNVGIIQVGPNILNIVEKLNLNVILISQNILDLNGPKRKCDLRYKCILFGVWQVTYNQNSFSVAAGR